MHVVTMKKEAMNLKENWERYVGVWKDKRKKCCQLNYNLKTINKILNSYCFGTMTNIHIFLFLISLQNILLLSTKK